MEVLDESTDEFIEFLRNNKYGRDNGYPQGIKKLVERIEILTNMIEMIEVYAKDSCIVEDELRRYILGTINS